MGFDFCFLLFYVDSLGGFEDLVLRSQLNGSVLARG